jgi:hypothetical protein
LAIIGKDATIYEMPWDAQEVQDVSIPANGLAGREQN